MATPQLDQGMVQTKSNFLQSYKLCIFWSVFPYGITWSIQKNPHLVLTFSDFFKLLLAKHYIISLKHPIDLMPKKYFEKIIIVKYQVGIFLNRPCDSIGKDASENTSFMWLPKKFVWTPLWTSCE